MAEGAEGIAIVRRVAVREGVYVPRGAEGEGPDTAWGTRRGHGRGGGVGGMWRRACVDPPPHALEGAIDR